METESRHQCLIYDGPPSQKLSIIADIIIHKLAEGYRCLYLNSAPMVAGIRSTLAAMGVDVEYELASARIVLSSEPISDGWDFNIDEMLNNLNDALDDAIKDGYKGLWASGDMTWEFGPQKNFAKLLEYELRLEEMFNTRKELCGVCQYHKDSLPHDTLRQSLLVHPKIVVSGTLSRINPYYLKSSWPTDQSTNSKLDTLIAELCK